MPRSPTLTPESFLRRLARCKGFRMDAATMRVAFKAEGYYELRARVKALCKSLEGIGGKKQAYPAAYDLCCRFFMETNAAKDGNGEEAEAARCPSCDAEFDHCDNCGEDF